MRIYKKKEKIDYFDSKKFFSKRASIYNKNNPYMVTMYQDNNPSLVNERNKREKEKLMPYLSIGEKTKVLDIACGIGRWADDMPDNICEYFGIDFSEELICIAKEHNARENFYFYVGELERLERIINEERKQKYNTILMVGILMYINDDDMDSILSQVEKVSDQHCVICIREPIALKERLTLKDFYSEELKDNYNAIYRTNGELCEFFGKAFLKKGFSMKKSAFLFDDSLNNREETAQYYYILER